MSCTALQAACSVEARTPLRDLDQIRSLHSSFLRLAVHSSAQLPCHSQLHRWMVSYSDGLLTKVLWFLEPSRCLCRCAYLVHMGYWAIPVDRRCRTNPFPLGWWHPYLAFEMALPVETRLQSSDRLWKLLVDAPCRLLVFWVRDPHNHLRLVHLLPSLIFRASCSNLTIAMVATGSFHSYRSSQHLLAPLRQ